MKKINILLFVTLILLVGCSKSPIGLYPTSLMWEGSIYSTDIDSTVDESYIGSELGKIMKQVQPAPEKDGQINDVSNFTLGDKFFSIKNVDTTEAIAIMRNGKYFRINRIRSSLGIVWDNKMYDFEGNFDNENENVDKQIGQVNKVGISYSDAENGDITVNGFLGDLSIFPVGGRINSIKNIESDKAIAVEDKDGKFHKAKYVKKINK